MTETPRVHRRQVFGPLDRIAFVGLTLLGLAALGWFALAWVGLGYREHPWLYLAVTVLLSVIAINQQGRWFLLLPMRRPVPMPAIPSARVAVATTYVAGAESRAMIEATLEAMLAIEVPHDTWLLDESDDPAMRELCARLGVHHFTRRSDSRYRRDSGPFRDGTKHGNYNAWLDAVGYRGYDFLAAFDPDHVPMPGYLDGTLGYFADPAIGYVQPAQAYYNQHASLVARGAAEETYAYFSAVQMASYGLDYPIIVGGHNVHRVSALEALGGYAAHDADDLLLTLRYRAAGWRGVYVPEILARGLTPVDWRSYLVQQRRWARSVLDLKINHHHHYADALPLGTRVMSILHGLNFLHRSVAWLAIVVIAWYLLATGQTLHVLDASLVQPALLLLTALGLQELFRQRFYLDWRHEAGAHWRSALLEFAKWPWFLLALGDVITRRRVAYTITWKSPREGHYRPFVAWNLGLAAAFLVAWLVGGRGNPEADPAILAVGLGIAVVSLALALAGLHRPPDPFRIELLHAAMSSATQDRAPAAAGR